MGAVLYVLHGCFPKKRVICNLQRPGGRVNREFGNLGAGRGGTTQGMGFFDCVTVVEQLIYGKTGSAVRPADSF